MKSIKIFLLFVFIIILSTSKGINKVRAVEQVIGTHLVQGDPGGQLAVLNKLKNELPSTTVHYPVVIMLDATNPSSISPLAQATQGDQFDPIIRVFKIFPTTRPELVGSMMDGIASAVGQFKSGTPVELGNEINNQDPSNGEWKSSDYSLYGQMFDSLANSLSSKGLSASHPLGISAMDTLNAVYHYDPILSTIIASIQNKSAITAVFANIYETSGGGSLGDGGTVLTKINSLIGSSMTVDTAMYITEFGTVQCSDWDCIQNFYDKHKGFVAKAKVGFTRTPSTSTGSDFYHTVPIICQYWKADGSLAVVKPSQCGSAGNIYLYPGIDDQTTTDAKIDTASHYMMTCGSQMQFSGNIQNEGLLSGSSSNFVKTANCPTDGSCTVNASGAVTIDYSNSTIPLFRLQDASVPNPDAKTRRKDDLEGFFGSTYTGNSVDQPEVVPLANGTVNKIPNSCQNKVDFLRAIHDLCAIPPTPYPSPINNSQLVVPPSPTTTQTCALDLAIPGTNETYLSTYNKLPTNFDCTDINAYNNLDTTTQTLLSKVETTTPKAFKPAYIVRYVNSPVDSPDGSYINQFATWFNPEILPTPTTNAYKSRIQITKIYVPANVSSQSLDIKPSTPNFESSIVRTLKAFVSGGEQQALEKQKSEEISAIRSLSTRTVVENAVSHLPIDGVHVNCPECTDSNTLESVLTKRINAEIDFQHVENNDNTACTLPDVVGELGSQIKQSINPPGNVDPVESRTVNIQAQLRALGAHLGTNKDDIVIRTYLLLPEEYRNLQNYEKVFAQVVFNRGQEPTFIDHGAPQDPTSPDATSYKYLQLGDTKVVTSYPDAVGGVIGYTVNPNPSPGASPTSSTAVNLKGNLSGPNPPVFNANPTVPGGQLSRALWQVMCGILNPVGVDPTKYPGFEKFLTQGCTLYTPTSTTPPVCNLTDETISCKNFRPGSPQDEIAWTPSLTEASTACTPNGSPQGYGQEAEITSGLVKLALQVSKDTCTPAEMLIGVLAKESKGLLNDTSSPLTGDPTQIMIRNQCTSPDPVRACGPYSYAQGELWRQITHFGDVIVPCLQDLNLAPAGFNGQNATFYQFDTREVGVAMCVAAANMWRETTLSFTFRACDHVPRTLQTLPANEVKNGVEGFHYYPYYGGDPDGAWYNYQSFIDQYHWLVDRVRSELISCVSR